MGTRASFWIGNPGDLQNRAWLGCITWDGYPDGLPGIENISSIGAFRAYVATELSGRDDFANPKGGWPYPWDDDIYLTDYTYAFFDDAVQVTCFHQQFRTINEELNADPNEEWDNTLPTNIPAPSKYDRTQPDSIMILSYEPS